MNLRSKRTLIVYAFGAAVLWSPMLAEATRMGPTGSKFISVEAEADADLPIVAKGMVHASVWLAEITGAAKPRVKLPTIEAHCPSVKDSAGFRCPRQTGQSPLNLRIASAKDPQVGFHRNQTGSFRNIAL